MIGVLKSGNYRSVYNALTYLNFNATIVELPDELKPSYSALIVPGNGNFQSFMERIQLSCWKEMILHWIKSERPYLGICVGFQILFEISEETITSLDSNVSEQANAKTNSGSKPAEGLGIIPGSVKKFPNGKVPLIGWNYTAFTASSNFSANKTGDYFYYIHSYYAECQDTSIICALAEYEGAQYCAGIVNNTITAVQFHPERSGIAGLTMLKNWADKAESPTKTVSVSIGGQRYDS